MIVVIRGKRYDMDTSLLIATGSTMCGSFEHNLQHPHNVEIWRTELGNWFRITRCTLATGEPLTGCPIGFNFEAEAMNDFSTRYWLETFNAYAAEIEWLSTEPA